MERLISSLPPTTDLRAAAAVDTLHRFAAAADTLHCVAAAAAADTLHRLAAAGRIRFTALRRRRRIRFIAPRRRALGARASLWSFHGFLVFVSNVSHHYVFSRKIYFANGT